MCKFKLLNSSSISLTFDLILSLEFSMFYLFFSRYYFSCYLIWSKFTVPWPIRDLTSSFKFNFYLSYIFWKSSYNFSYNFFDCLISLSHLFSSWYLSNFYCLYLEECFCLDSMDLSLFSFESSIFFYFYMISSVFIC